MKRACLLFALCAPAVAFAHHGVAGLGTAGLQGPGAPVEAATSSTLPAGSGLIYLKLDHARYERGIVDDEPEARMSQYWMMGAGYGFTPWLSGYVFLPYHTKVDDKGGFDTRGFADVSLFGQIGFKYDEGFRLVPETEGLDDLEDWHFTVFGGATLPTGDANLADDEGEIDPGKSTGFGKPSWMLGVTATKMLTPRLTFNVEASTILFQEYEYDDGNKVKFGTEKRLNGGLAYRAWTDPDLNMRLDLVLEAQYLHLGRDRENGVGEEGTGGAMIYALPGVRLYWDRFSFAFGVKKPIWTDLNEADTQQGAEGKEDYRLIFSASALF